MPIYCLQSMQAAEMWDAQRSLTPSRPSAGVGGRGRAANASSGKFRPDHFNINSGRPLAFPAKQHHPPRPPLFYLYPPLLDPASIPPLSARAATDPTCYYFSAASFSACLWTTGRRAAGRKPPPPLFVFVSPVPCRSSKLCCRYRPPL